MIPEITLGQIDSYPYEVTRGPVKIILRTPERGSLLAEVMLFDKPIYRTWSTEISKTVQRLNLYLKQLWREHGTSYNGHKARVTNNVGATKRPYETGNRPGITAKVNAGVEQKDMGVAQTKVDLDWSAPKQR